MELQKNKADEFLAFRRALTEESDRGCALFAAAYLDEALGELLRASFVASKEMGEELFEGTAPLATFSSRIKLAFYLGKISRACRGDFDLIRKIRNDLAHSAELVSFDTPSVADRCRNLSFSHHTKDARPRGHFTSAASAILAKIHALTIISTAPEPPTDDRPSEKMKQEARDQAENMLQEVLKRASE